MGMYDKEKLLNQAKKAIKEERLIFIDEVVAYLPCSLDTFYKYFPVGSEESEELKQLINNNKIEIKKGLRKKWYEGDNATTQLALYRLTSTQEEHHKLNQNYTDHTSNGETINQVKDINLHIQDFTEKEEEEDED